MRRALGVLALLGLVACRRDEVPSWQESSSALMSACAGQYDPSAGDVLGPLGDLDPGGLDWICNDPCWPDLSAEPLEKSDGSAPAKATPSLFLLGIQGGDTAINGDAATLAFYYNLSRNSPGSGADWTLISYYNGTNANQLAAPPEIRVRTGFATTQAGDFRDTRELANWALDPNANNEWWVAAARDEIRGFIDRTADAIVAEAVAGRPIYVHSGGGSVVAAALRRMSMKAACDPVWAQLKGKTLQIVGLEMAFSQELRDTLVRELGAKQPGLTVNIRNIVARDRRVWHGLIACAIIDAGQTPLATDVINVDAVLNGQVPYTYNTAAGNVTIKLSPHAGLASWVLSNGRIPPTAPANRDDRACIRDGKKTYGPGDTPPVERPPVDAATATASDTALQ